ncbi:MAG TPA: hypothetical protein VIH57_06375 [Bacteroidales bacterium]
MENRENTERLQPEEKASQVAVEFEKEYLTNDIQKSASWFFWIAGLSIINTVIYTTSGGVYFVIGLGISQFVDGIVTGLMDGPSLISLIPNLLIAGFFVLIGYRARKYSKRAFITGVIIYTLDALLFLYFREWMAFGFHVFALVMISKGFFKIFEYDKACKQVTK